MNICLAILLLSSTVVCQQGNDLQSTLIKDYKMNCKPYPANLTQYLIPEVRRDEEIVPYPGHIFDVGKDVLIGNTNRFNTSVQSSPWVVAIHQNGDHFCTGSILNPEWIITAGHCFGERNDPTGMSIKTGTESKNQGHQYNLTKIFVHPRYDMSKHKSSDVALIKVAGPIKFYPQIQPIGLPTQAYEEPLPGSQAMSTGWGKANIEASQTDHYLGEIWLTVMRPEICASAYKKLGPNGHPIFRSQICTWNLGQNVCQGNSGGPLVEFYKEKPILRGTVSYGVKCIEKYPIVFSKVSYFLGWINQVIRDN